MSTWKVEIGDSASKRQAHGASAVPLKWAHDALTGDARYIRETAIYVLQGRVRCRHRARFSRKWRKEALPRSRSMFDVSLSDADYVPQGRMHLWWLGVPSAPVLIGDISLVEAGRGVSLKYSDNWLRTGFALSEDLPLLPQTFMPHAKDTAAGAVDDARPDRWGERLIRVLDKPKRLSLLEYLYFSGDDRFGALGVSLRSDIYLPRTRSVLPTLADVGQIHAIVRKVIAGEPPAALISFVKFHQKKCRCIETSRTW